MADSKLCSFPYSRQERLSIERRKTKTKVITTADQRRGRYHLEPIRILNKTNQTAYAREKASDRFMIGFSLASDWLREWCEFSGPITERSKAKQRNPGLLLTLSWKLLQYRSSLWWKAQNLYFRQLHLWHNHLDGSLISFATVLFLRMTHSS